jgi:hypothetical protein
MLPAVRGARPGDPAQLVERDRCPRERVAMDLDLLQRRATGDHCKPDCAIIPRRHKQLQNFDIFLLNCGIADDKYLHR